jgi:FkbM family methyltransferase
MSLLKSVIKNLPGAKWAARRLRAGAADNVGEWLYRQEVVTWLSRPELRRQMPLLYRGFGRYGQAQSLFWDGPIVGGATAFKAVMRLSDWFHRPDCVALNTGKYTVFLNLRDPRMLAVPRELLVEGPEVGMLKSCLAEGDTFLDVGANHGSYAIIAARQVGASGWLLAVEPQPRMAALVEQSLRANARCRFEVHAIACGDRNGEAALFVPESSSGAAGLFAGYSATAAHRQLTVPLRRFDDAFDWRNFPGEVVLKLDVEGSELLFLRGARAMMRARKPRILLEINPKSACAAGGTVTALIAGLLELGYARFAELSLPLTPRPLHEMDVGRQRNLMILP